ncbi:hypothetical protein [Streptomyces narbonensis]|uniref:hypothetical protein n=1 Tax=Streptomyces narbonensis TaxID=67333 RepID=UPI0033D34D8B
MEIIKKLKARASRAQRVLRNRLAHSSGERLIAESIAGVMPTLDIATPLNQATVGHLIAGLPRPDLSGLLPQLDLSHLVPKIDYSRLFPLTTINQIAAAALAGGIRSPAEDDDEDSPVFDVDNSTDPETGPSEADAPDTDR